MAGLQRHKTLDALRTRIAGLENRPILDAPERASATGIEGLLSTPPGLLHEVFTPEQRNTGAALGFALGQARALLTSARPALLYLQLRKDAQDIGVPYGGGLAHFGIDPDAVVIGRLDSMVELLWALEEAVCCRAVAAVIADIPGHPKALDFTASRRLHLRAADAKTSIFLLRYGDAREASAAQIRWRITPRVSEKTMFDARAPAGPRFGVALEKGRIGAAQKAAGAGTSFSLDWTKNGFVVVNDSTANHQLDPANPAASGAAPAPLGHRLSETG